MKTDFNFENAKVGDKVYHVVWGWTEINEIDNNLFTIKSGPFWYNFNGRFAQSNENPTIYPYNPFEQNQERVVEVEGRNNDWIKRVLIMVKNGKAVCWANAESLEQAINESVTYTWNKWREIQEPKKELTQEEKINILWEKYGKEL